MKDQLVKAMALEGRVRYFIVSTKEMLTEIQERFDMSAQAVDPFGRVLSIGSIMGSMLKNEQEMLTINLMGSGPIGDILVDAYAGGNVRGFVANPQIMIDTTDLSSADLSQLLVGNQGTLTVTKDLSMEENWSGTVELQSGRIGDDFAYYFYMSEQTPSAVSVGVKVGTDGKPEAAGALVLQMMPDATDTDISICEHVISGLKPMSEILEHYDDTDLKQLAEDLFEDAKIVDDIPVRFYCPCSRERARNLLSVVDLKELQNMVDEKKDETVVCNFCNESYTFTPEELEEILNERTENKTDIH